MKPRIARYADDFTPMWCCWSADCGLQGYGETPEDAYAEWREYAGKSNKVTPMNDKHKRIEAMYHLEMLMTGAEVPQDVANKRIAAAHYIVQSMFGGCKPENYDEVMREVNELDAAAETQDLIRRTKVSGG